MTTETVDIPGEPRLSNPVPPPIAVRLPIVTWPHEFKNVLLGLLALPIGAMSAFVFVELVLGAHVISLSVAGCFIFLVVLPLSLITGVSFVAVAFTCFWDAVRGDPVIEITSDGLRDPRAGLSAPWSSIKSARSLDPFSIDLELRGPVTVWQNPFRVGVFMHRYRPKPNHVIVSVRHLHMSAHVLAYTILTLIRRNGGEVVTKLPSGLDMYPRLIPRRL